MFGQDSRFRFINTRTALGYDFAVSFLSNFATFYLIKSLFPSDLWNVGFVLRVSLAVTVIQCVLYYVIGLYQSIWSYSSIPDMIRVLKGASLAAICCGLFALFFKIEFKNILLLLIFDWGLLVLGLGSWPFDLQSS